ncbi:MAG: transcriptional regulator NrdR [Xanthomonadales bacterium]|nr:transcriptional regulator NrdR [Xanthomonadales bacterium]
MRCPFCGHPDTRVIDTRLADEGLVVRRRRECPQCHARFSTFESAELKMPQVVKNDGRREPFDEGKLRGGIERAMQKRPFGARDIDAIVERVKHRLRSAGEREVASRRIGEWVMQELKRVDQVAYVRFASVYRRFADLRDFREEVERLENDLGELGDRQLPLLDDGS